MINIQNLIVEELMKEDLTIDELKSLTKDISDHDLLNESLRNHPSIDFECIELSSDFESITKQVNDMDSYYRAF